MIVHLALAAWVLLVAFGVWAGTRQRPGTSDEIRTLAAVLAALSIAAGLFVLGALPANAHNGHEIEAWETEWRQRLDTHLDTHAGRLSAVPLEELLALAEERTAFQAAHAWHYNPPPPPTPKPTSRAPRRSTVSVPGNVEGWRPLVAGYFPADQVDRALCIIWHESRGNPNADNPTSSATGLFQVLASLWAPHYGVTTAQLYNPETNTRIAAAIWRSQGWWAWSPYKRGECR